MSITRQVTWGDALVIAVFKSQGGINAAVTRIRNLVGAQVGVRNTFSKLLRTEDPRKLGERDQFRAWLLLAALGEDPADWEVPESVVPPVYNPAALREALRPSENPDGDPSEGNSATGEYGSYAGEVVALRQLIRHPVSSLEDLPSVRTVA